MAPRANYKRSALASAAASPCPRALPGLAPGGSGAWKDLQVLSKTISRDELKKTMKAMSKDLGVDCSFCHEEPNMEKDTNKKTLAREMMQMTSEINKRYASTMKKVTCFTCHRGKEEPERQK
ncbi:hypothetical protein BVG81_006430 [Haliangium sp. UPWRP_2]|nr:hypothetical protein BVG81_006430 [Haliangium sp. UPWRP_2]